MHKHTSCGQSQQLRHSLGLMGSEKHSRLHHRLIWLSRPFGRNARSLIRMRRTMPDPQLIRDSPVRSGSLCG